MGTRSAIGLLEDGKIKAVYCHWDGYVDHNGRILEESYRDVDKVKQLLALGDLSVLGNAIGEKHRLSEEPGSCSFYGRDRDEDGCDPKYFDTAKEMCDWYDDSEYFYLMKNGVWFVNEGNGSKWTLLSVAIDELGDIE